MPRRIPTILSGGTGGASPPAPGDGIEVTWPAAPTTTADFKTWLASGERRCALIEIVHPYQSGSSPIPTSTIYLSTVPYATEPVGDSPASISYADVVTSLPTWSVSCDEEMPVGLARTSYGSIEIDNTDQRSNYLLQVPLQGRPVSIYLGDRLWDRASFKLVNVARVDMVESIGINRIAIRLRDATTIANRRIEGTAVGGSGPNANRIRPKVWGRVHNAEAVLGDYSNLRYWIADASGVTIDDVRDKGVSLKDMATVSGTYTVIVADPATDTLQPQTDWTPDTTTLVVDDLVTLSSTGTYPSGLSAGTYWVKFRELAGSYWRYQLSATRGGSTIEIGGDGSYSGTLTMTRHGFKDNGDGSIDLAHEPTGQITYDAHTTTPTYTYTYSSADGLYETACIAAGLSSGDYANYHSSVTSASPFLVAAGYLMTQPTNLFEILDEICATAQTAIVPRYDGKMQLTQILNSWNVSASADFALTDDDMVNRDAMTLRTTPKSYSKALIEYNRNWTVQSAGELAESLDAETKAGYGVSGLVTESYVVVDGTNVWSAGSGGWYGEPHKFYEGAAESVSKYIRSLVSNSNLTTAETNAGNSRYSYILRRPPDVLEVVVGLDHYEREIGDICTCTFTGSPLGVNSGSYWVVIGKAIDVSRNRMTLKLWRSHYWPTATTSQYYG